MSSLFKGTLSIIFLSAVLFCLNAGCGGPDGGASQSLSAPSGAANYPPSGIGNGGQIEPYSAAATGPGGYPPPKSGNFEPLAVQAQRFDTSRPLRDIVPIPPKFGGRAYEIPSFQIPGRQLPDTAAPAGGGAVEVQKAIPRNYMPATDQNFEGVGNVNGVAPPDTNGDVGPNHYIQIVNISFAIYDKTGGLLYGPANNNTIWSGFGGDCETHNDGDPIVLYDELADRWLISQFALNFGSSYHQCIAISQTPDPLGAWHRYDFLVSTSKMNDYPKFGVWPDAYYMTANQFACCYSWGGVGVWAFERDKMLLGQSAQMVYFDLYSVNPNFGGMLPSDVDGQAPPSGSPNYFVEIEDSVWGFPTDQASLWEFHVDWTNPGNSTFGLSGNPNISLPVASFDSNMCGGSRNCIPQPGTSSKLDAIADRLMYRAQYRNFGSYETIVINHTVDTNGTDHAGVKWYELRRSGGSWSVHQEGVVDPDAEHRWMGSIAMDVSGNIAVGYSLSSATTYPSIKYSGRLKTDPLGTMPQGEGTIIAGGGSTTSPNRWGDYSMMGVDPVDQCAFWYTQEYIASNGSWNWQTRVGSFKFPSCSLCTSDGALDMDEPKYALNDTVTIRLSDCDLNIAPGTPETASVTISSDTEPGGEPVSLTEVGPDQGIFEGTINVAPGAAGSDGVLQVAGGDTITVTYLDASPPSTVTATAIVDDTPPVISNVAAHPDASGAAASITWNTDEDADATVYYGLTSALGQTASSTAVGMSHVVDLSGLTPSATYYYDVESADTVGNAFRDDNGGAHYTFNTAPPEIDVTPLTVSVSTHEGGQVAGSISISNLGTGADLTFSITDKDPASGGIAFQDDMESGTNGWTSIGLWHQEADSMTCGNSQSPTHSWYYGQAGICDYDTGFANFGNLTSPSFTVPANGQLSFWSWESTEGGGWDVTQVFISVNGGATWTMLTDLTNDTGAWYPLTLDISSYAGSTAQIRFHFDTIDAAFNSYPGWYIDDVVVQGSASDVVWLTENPATGWVSATSTQPVALEFDALDMAPGTYTASVVIANDDSNENPTTVSADMTITASARPEMFSTVVDDDNIGESTGDGDGYIEPNENIELVVVLENMGSLASGALTGTLSSPHPEVTITDGAENFPAIAVGGTGATVDDFGFMVSNLALDGEVIPFDLALTDGSLNWNLSFTLTVQNKSSVMGTVTRSATGAPIAGATITATGPDVMSAASSLDGTYRIDGLTSGAYTITCAAPGQENGIPQNVTLPPDAAGVNFALDDLYSIDGIVVNSATLGAIPGATVQYAGPDGGFTTTDVNGMFFISDLSAGNYNIIVTVPGLPSPPTTNVDVPPNISGLVIQVDSPDVSVAPTSLEVSIPPNSTTMKNLSISNAGTLDSSFSIIEQSVTGNQPSFNPPAGFVIYAADYSTNEVKKVDEFGTVTNFYAAALPWGMTWDSAGNMYVVVKGGADTIHKVDPSGAGSVFATGFSSIYGLAIDSSDNVYVADLSAGTVVKITPGGVKSVFASGLSGPMSLTFDQAGNLYVGEYFADQISKVDPSGVVTLFASPVPVPYDIGFDSAGYLYASTVFGGDIKKISPDGSSIISFATLPGCTLIGGLEVDQSADLVYATCMNNGSLYEINQSGAASLLVNVGGPNIVHLAMPGSTGVDWLDEIPQTGNVPAGGSALIDVIFDSAGKAVGRYKAILKINNDDPANPEIDVPVTMTVANGAYLYIDSSVLDDDNVPPSSGNGSGQAEPGETIELLVTARNSGIATATNVVGTMTTADIYATITAGVQGFGTLTPGLSSTAPSFVFDVSPSTPDGHDIVLDFTFQDAASNTWTDSITVTVYRYPPFDLNPWSLAGATYPGGADTQFMDITNVGSLSENFIIEGVAGIPWLTMTPETGVLGPGATQTITADFDATGLTPGTYTGTITVRNTDPAARPIPVPVTFTVSNSPILFVKSHIIDDDNAGSSSGNGNGLLEPGETAEVPVEIVNYGGLPGSGITGTLSITDPLITITDNSEVFPDLNPIQTGFTLDDFDFSVDPGAGSYLAVFDLDLFETSTGQTFNRQLTIPIVLTPEIDLSPTSVMIVVQEGDTASGAFSISNFGSADLTGAVSESPPQPWLSVTPAAINVAPGSVQAVQVNADPGTMGVGLYTNHVIVSTNDVDESVAPVTVRMSVFSGSNIQVMGTTIDDDTVGFSMGDGDGFLEPGERIELGITLENIGSMSAPGVTATLTSLDLNTSVVVNQAAYGDIAASANATMFDYVVKVDSSVADGAVLQFQLDVATTDGRAFTRLFTLTVLGSYEVTGIVSETLSGTPLGGAAVDWTGPGGTSGSATTAADGSYAISNLPAGAYNLTASKSGYGVRAAQVVMPPDHQTVDLPLDGPVADITPAAMSVYIPLDISASANSVVNVADLGAVDLGYQVAIYDDTSVPLGGPDAFGYLFYDTSSSGGPASAFIDISVDGTLIPGFGDDTNIGPVAIGFDFPFYGQTFSAVNVCSNGWLSFTDTTNSFIDRALPDPLAPGNLIAPFWKDLDLSVGGQVFYRNDSDKFIIEFLDVFGITGDGPYTFEAILAPQGAIRLEYLQTQSTSGVTVGIQNADGSDGLTVVNRQPYLLDGDSVLIAPGVFWMTVAPLAGTVTAGSNVPLGVVFDVAGLALSSRAYDGRIEITSNDPEDSPWTVPVTMTLDYSPIIITSPILTATENSVYNYDVNATDPDGDILNYSLEVSPGGMTIDSATGLIDWLPLWADVGNNDVAVLVEDGFTGEARQAFTIAVDFEDADGDGLPDTWEVSFGLDPTDATGNQGAAGDPDGDGLTNMDEYLLGLDPMTSNAPTAPSLNAPANSVEVADDTPLLSVNNASDPDGDALTYEFELYEDAGLTIPAGSVTGVSEGAAVTDWQISTQLTDNHWYYWRAKANDGLTIGPWMSPASFRVNLFNDPPGMPGISAPPDGGAVASVTPILEVNETTDIDLDPLVYYFEVYLDQARIILVDYSLAMPEEGDGTTAWTVATPLLENQWYYWTAWAVDDESLAGPAVSASFQVNINDEPPFAPTVYYPQAGNEISSLTPTLAVKNGWDPEGLTLTYQFQVDTTPNFNGPGLLDSGVVFEGVDYSYYTVPALADNTWYYWRVRSNDGALSSGWVASSFMVNQANDPPSTPTPQQPADGQQVSGLSPTFTALPATDVDGDSLVYFFELYLDAGMTQLVELSSAVTRSGNFVSWDINNQLTDGQTYYWRVWAVDEHDMAGAPCPLQSFQVVKANSPPGGLRAIMPRGGVQIGSPQPELIVRNATDPDGDALTYEFEIYADSGLTSIVAQGAGVPEVVDETSWLVPVGLSYGFTYFWRARAFDGNAHSPWTSTASFMVGQLNPIIPAPAKSGGGGGGCAVSSTGAYGMGAGDGLLVLLLFAFTAIIAGRKHRRGQRINRT